MDQSLCPSRRFRRKRQRRAILTFFEAQDIAKELTRGADGSADNAPITVDGALIAYRAELISRNANAYNTEWPRLHLTSALCRSRWRCSRPPN